MEGWVNADINPDVKVDVQLAKDNPVPFEDNQFDCVLLDNVLEHIPKDQLFGFLDEMYRILKNGGTLDIYVPHYTSVFAWANLSHYSAFAVGTLDCVRAEGGVNTGERYGKASFEIEKEELLLFGHNIRKIPMLSKLPINFIFNLSWMWKKAMERFQLLGFDEIHYVLKAVKQDAP